MVREPPRVVVVSGHMVDIPGRASKRFPAEEVPRVAADVRHTFERWGVGPQTTLISGGARGADIIAAEEATARGAKLRLVLSLPPDEFERVSVELPSTDWAARFRAMLEVAEVDVIQAPSGDDVFERTNQRMVQMARSFDPHPHAVIVWDGGGADGPGGTRDFVAQLGEVGSGDRVHVIDPRPRT